MKNTFRNKIIICFLITFLSKNYELFGQKKIDQLSDTSKFLKVVKKNGFKVVGKTIKKDSLNILFKSIDNEAFQIPIDQVKRVYELEESNVKKGKYWFVNPFPTRYLFGTSAFSLKSGKGYYQNNNVVLNSFYVGITNHISVGGGFELVSLIEKYPIFYLMPKINFQIAKKLHLGGGLVSITIPSYFDNSRDNYNIAYLTTTYGTLDKNISYSIGWGRFAGNFSKLPYMNLSAMNRFSKNVAVITENLYLPYDYFFMSSAGLRFFGPSFSFDLGLLNIPELSEFSIIGFPYVSFSIKF